MIAVEENDPVRITHYINPHCFWYKSEMAYLPLHEQRKFLDDFNEYCERKFGRRSQEPPRTWLGRTWYKQNGQVVKVGDLVAQYNKELHRWIRCEVEDILDDLSGVVWYQLWAMDEGLPIKSTEENFRPLPQLYAGYMAHAKRGALHKVLPSETRYDYVLGENIVKTCSSWSPGIVATLETILDDALSVCMVETSQILIKNEVVHFCEIFIKTHHDKSFNVKDMLSHACSDQFTIPRDEEFLKVVPTLKTLNMVRFKNNDGVDTLFSKINFLGGPDIEKFQYMLGIYNATTVTADCSAQDKIGEWFSRNMKAFAEDQKFEGEEKKMVPLINGGAETAGENKMLHAQRAVAQTGKETNESNETPHDRQNSPVSAVQNETKEKEKDIVASFTGHTINIVQPIGSHDALESVDKQIVPPFMKRVHQMHAIRRQLGILKNPTPTCTTQPILGPAGCSIGILLNNMNNRSNRKAKQ